MSVFGLYSRYYDLLYREKDYAGEAAFVSGELRGAQPAARTLLELGCGTGRHALALAELRWSVTGIDLSAGMIAAAKERQRSAPRAQDAQLEFHEGDIRDVRLGRRFDCVTSLFHVMSYQTTDADLAAAFSTAADHLQPGGLFFFDFWYGPAVLADQPSIRIKRLRDEALHVTRIAEPEFCPARNGVVVNYDIFLDDRESGVISEIKEQHSMRYFFLPELVDRLKQHRLMLLHSSAWMSHARPVGPDTWYGCILAQAETSPV